MACKKKRNQNPVPSKRLLCLCASLPLYLSAFLPFCLSASLPLCLAASLPLCLSAPLPHSLGAFKAWLESQALDFKIVNINIQGLEYFFMMLDMGVEQSYSHMGLLETHYKEGFFQRLMSLPVMSPRDLIHNI